MSPFYKNPQAGVAFPLRNLLVLAIGTFTSRFFYYEIGVGGIDNGYLGDPSNKGVKWYTTRPALDHLEEYYLSGVRGHC